MAQNIPTLISVDPNGGPAKQKNIHTRWHPEIPAVATIDQGKPFRIQCMDFTGNFIQNNDLADDVLDLPWESDHHLSGPIAVKGAEPGDVLRVDIMDVSPFAHRAWGFSLVDPRLGPLNHEKTKVAKSIWDFKGTEATSRHILDISFHGRPHCGVIGTAPSRELLKQWFDRENALNERYRCHGIWCADMPSEAGAYIGQDLSIELESRIRSEGARTRPAREHGGNIDSSSLTAGASIFLPVFVPGANVSVGDLHFSAGDGEPTCAIEMAGIATLRCTILKGGMTHLGLKAPMVIPSPSQLAYSEQLVFHGLSLDPNGVQQPSDSTTSYIQAATNAMDYLEKLGYSHEQACMIMATAPIETRILSVPNIPTANVSVGLPTRIFGFEILPSEEGSKSLARGSAAYLSAERGKAYEENRKEMRRTFDRVL